MRVFGCLNDTEPCVIERGQRGKLEVDFVAPFDARSLYLDVRARTGPARLPIYVPWPGLDRDACKNHGLSCPVKRGAPQTYFYEMLVDQAVPQIKTDAVWRLTDFWGFNVACFRVDMNIARQKKSD